MKTLKITLLLFAVLLLTVSGQSSDLVVDSNDTKIDKQDPTKYDLLASNKKRLQKPNNG
jgi:hypothetical protein|nr:hypothetical protein [uncultured Psychroserpens sp.]